MTYQGWKNYETWSCKLWIDNDEGNYKYWRAACRRLWRNRDEDQSKPEQSQVARTRLANELAGWILHEAPDLPASFYSDILSANLREIDTYEIADALFVDKDEDDYVPRKTLAAQEVGG